MVVVRVLRAHRSVLGVLHRTHTIVRLFGRRFQSVHSSVCAFLWVPVCTTIYRSHMRSRFVFLLVNFALLLCVNDNTRLFVSEAAASSAVQNDIDDIINEGPFTFTRSTVNIGADLNYVLTDVYTPDTPQPLETMPASRPLTCTVGVTWTPRQR